MASNEKVYTTKSSATRALKKMEDAEKFQIIGDDEYGWQIIEAEDEAEPVEKVISRPGTTRNGNCRKVWDMADAMPGARRIDVVKACVDAGIAEGTAKTQYQHWFKAQKES